MITVGSVVQILEDFTPTARLLHGELAGTPGAQQEVRWQIALAAPPQYQPRASGGPGLMVAWPPPCRVPEIKSSLEPAQAQDGLLKGMAGRTDKNDRRSGYCLPDGVGRTARR